MGNVVTKLRFSEYLPFEKVSQHIFRLREFYNVGYFEATYYSSLMINMMTSLMIYMMKI